MGLAKIPKASVITGTDPRSHLAEGGKLAGVRSSTSSLEPEAWAQGPRAERKMFPGQCLGPGEEGQESATVVLHGLGPVCCVDLMVSLAGDKPVV